MYLSENRKQLCEHTYAHPNKQKIYYSHDSHSLQVCACLNMEISCVNKQSQVNTNQTRDIIQPITDIADQTWHIPVNVKHSHIQSNKGYCYCYLMPFPTIFQLYWYLSSQCDRQRKLEYPQEIGDPPQVTIYICNDYTSPRTGIVLIT